MVLLLVWYLFSDRLHARRSLYHAFNVDKLNGEWANQYMKWTIVAIVVFVTIILFVLLKRKQDELGENFKKRFSGKDIQYMDKYALYVATKSDGYKHFRGSGYLVLTNKELYFERLFKKKIIILPISSILNVGKTMRLAGQSPGSLMLKVTYKTQDGENDAIAWKVKDLERWIREVSAMMKNHI
jgi:hypothetical protein